MWTSGIVHAQGVMLTYRRLTQMHCLQERLSEAARLAQEMAVQAAAIEAARSNVEHHYTYICTHFREFMAWYVSSPRVHAASALWKPTRTPTTMGTASAHYNDRCVIICCESNRLQRVP